jgi:putative chitinase
MLTKIIAFILNLFKRNAKSCTELDKDFSTTVTTDEQDNTVTTTLTDNVLPLSELELVTISGMPMSRAAMYIDGLNQTLEEYNITNPVVICMFLGQMLHESAAFRYMTELASGTAYEGRKDLGNTVPGDGPRYKGRSIVMVTGRANYGQISQALGVDFVSQPDLLSTPPYCILAGGWFWNSRNLSSVASAGTEDAFRLVTKKINGGYNGYDDRKQYWDKAKKVLIC